MFRQMKTGSKILAGFALALGMTAVVGGVGWWAASSLTASLTDVGQVRLAAIQELGDIGIAASQFKTCQRTLLNLDLDASVRQ